MGLLTAEQILAAEDLKTEDVPCPEWGGAVRLRPLMAGERDLYEQLLGEGRDKQGRLRNIRALLVVMSAVNEAGERLFTEEQIEALSKKNAATLDRLFDAASRLSALGVKATEDLLKNSAPSPQDDSASSSPSA